MRLRIVPVGIVLALGTLLAAWSGAGTSPGLLPTLAVAAILAAALACRLSVRALTPSRPAPLTADPCCPPQRHRIGRQSDPDAPGQVRPRAPGTP